MSQEELSWLRKKVLVGYTDPKYGRGRAWHHSWDDEDSVANHYPDAIPIDDLLKKLFNFTVKEAEVIARVGDKEYVDPTRKAIVQPKSGVILGVHGEGYEVHQYQEWLLTKIADILDDELNIGSAGLLRNDALAFVSVEVPEFITTPEGVAFKPRLLGTTSHDGTAATTFNGCTTIAVCDNTVAIAQTEGLKFKVRHTRNSPAKLQDARQALGMVHTMADDFAKEIADLTSTKVSDKQFERFLNTLVPVPEKEGRGQTTAQAKQAVLRRLWNEDERVSPWRGTAWGALMANNTAEHHEYGVRGFRSERNLQKQAYGQFGAVDKQAFDALTAVLA